MFCSFAKQDTIIKYKYLKIPVEFHLSMIAHHCKGLSSMFAFSGDREGGGGGVKHFCFQGERGRKCLCGMYFSAP